MATSTTSQGISEADTRAVLEHVSRRIPIDPEVARRIRAEGARITAEIRQRFGVVDIAVDLIREVRDAE